MPNIHHRTKSKALETLRDPLSTLQLNIDHEMLELLVRMNITEIQELVSKYSLQLYRNSYTNLISPPGPDKKLMYSLSVHGLNFKESKYILKIQNKEYGLTAVLSCDTLLDQKHLRVILIPYLIYSLLFGKLLKDNPLIRQSINDIKGVHSLGLNSTFFEQDLKRTLQDNLETLADILNYLFTPQNKSTRDVENIFNLFFEEPINLKLKKLGKKNIELMGMAGLGTIAGIRSLNIILTNIFIKKDNGIFTFNDSFWKFLMHYNSELRHGGCPASFASEGTGMQLSDYQDLFNKTSGIESMFRTLHYITYYVSKHYDLLTDSLSFDMSNLES